MPEEQMTDVAADFVVVVLAVLVVADETFGCDADGST
jgi:hypothetical protein